MNKIVYALLTLLFFNTSLYASDILPANEAFVPRLSIQNNTLHVDFDIKDDYYMYKDKISINALDNTSFKNLNFSTAVVKNDPFFGDVEVYRKTANVHAEIESAEDTIVVEVGFQGCWDGGVCYPPIKQVHTLSYVANNSLVAMQSNTSFSSSNRSSSSQKNFFKELNLEENTEDPVHVDRAFILNATKIDDSTLNLRWDIRQDYYLYANKFNFDITGGEFGEIAFPKGKSKDDAFFGAVEVYYDFLSIDVPIDSEGRVMLTLTYQGCWDGGVCYPPVKKEFFFDFDQEAEISALPVESPTNPVMNINTQNSVENEELNAQDKITELLKNSSFWAIIGAFFLFGLALSFTPCVLPMIPILSNIIIGQGDISKGRAFFLSLVFVLAIAVMYTFAGVVAGSLDINFIIMFQNPYVVTMFALIFVALAFSMFGYFELQLPSAITTKLTHMSNKQKGGSVIGVAVMGLFTALIVGPCVAPPLAGSLLFISQTGDAILGGIALFTMAIGMGVPLIIIGSGIGSLPKAGRWMDTIKHLFGVMMIGVAIWVFDKILDEDIIILLWALLLTIAPIALGATMVIKSETSYAQRIYRALLLIVLGYGVLLLLLLARGGVNSGGHLLNPLGGSFVSSSQSNDISTQPITFKKVFNQDDINAVLQNTDKIVMLDFYADWCVYCEVYEKRIFSSSKVAPILANFELIKLDMTDYNDVHKSIMKDYDIFAPPTILFFQNGREIRSKRIVGELDTQEFYSHVSTVLNQYAN